MNQPYYDVIVNNYVENSVLTARVYQNKTVSIRIKRGSKLVDESEDQGYLRAFIERASEKLKGSSVNQFKISFDYRNHRLHFNLRKGGIVTTSTSQRVLTVDNKTEILFNNRNDIFYAQSPDVYGKFIEMNENAMGFIQIINHHANARKLTTQ